MLEGYVGKDVTEALMDMGPPDSVMDLPDKRRAFMWGQTASMQMPEQTDFTAYRYGNQVQGHATSYGGNTVTWECNYTLIGQRNPRNSYTIVSFRKPGIECE